MEEKEIQAQWKRVENYLDLLKYTVRERFGTLSTTSALSGTLLVVATFNKELLPVNLFIKILLVILLMLIPICLWGLIFGLHQSEEKAKEMIFKITEEVSKKNIESIKDRYSKSSFFGYLPIVVISILTLVIILICLQIFNVPNKIWEELTQNCI